MGGCTSRDTACGGAELLPPLPFKHPHLSHYFVLGSKALWWEWLCTWADGYQDITPDL